MGIKGLNQLLKRVCDSAHITLVPMCNFAEKKIAIDAALYVCAFKMRSNYVESIVEFLTMLRQNRIHPLFVFDGMAPEEKRGERLERAARREAARDRIKSLERDLDVYKLTGQLSDALKDVDCKARRLAPAKVSVARIQEYIDRLKSQVLNLQPQDFETMKSLLTCFDIPYVTANGEGEFLCAALARHQLVDAVMTSDTDALACLAPRIITKAEGEYFYVITLDTMLALLKLNEKEFIDLCIMCGTDFNANVAKIGPIRSYELILKYRSIDALPPEIDIAVLRHNRARELFSLTDCAPEMEIPLCGKVKYDLLGRWTDNVDLIKKKLKPKIRRPTQSLEIA